MSYTTIETSAQDGQPVELYEFYTVGTFYRYTSAAHAVVKGGDTFTPESIRRGDVVQNEEISKAGLRLTVPRENRFAASFLGFAPEGVTTLTLYRGHTTDTASEFVSYWKGRVLSAKADQFEIILECESVFSSLRRAGLRARYQRNCRHAIYQRGCLVSMDSYRVDGSVIAVSGNNITVSAAAGYADGYFTGGAARAPDGSFRFITAHAGDTISLARPFSVAMGGEPVVIFPGCDGLKATCETKFNNLLNFGGFPYFPARNPFDGGSLV